MRTRAIRAIAALLAALTLWLAPAGAAPPAKAIQGVWLSPDWILPGTRTYDERQVRAIARTTLAALEKQGINAVFMETLVRGSSIAPGGDLPVYEHLKWKYDSRGSRTVDALQILIDEAVTYDIAVHAWVHMFYWRMDNDDVFKPWQRAHSIWDDMLVAYMREQAASLKQRRKLPELQQAMQLMAASIESGGVDGRELSAILRSAGYDSAGRPLGRLIHELMAAGCPAPSFLLIGSPADPFPRTPNRPLRPIYINAADPKVRQRILASINAISDTHPDLAGIHLDHVRFPTEAQGIPVEWEPRGRDAVYLNPTIPVLAERYKLYSALMATRKGSLSSLVNEIRGRLHRGQALSAAVLPLYYVERSDGIERFNGYDYSAQDWHTWNVDFVVPMMYGFDPWRIRTLVKRFDNEVKALATDRPAPTIVPGVSKLKMVRSGLLGNDDFVFFDLTLGLDLRYVREHDEDYDWTPRRDI